MCLSSGRKPRFEDLVVGLLSDLPRSREQLIAENALLRQQLNRTLTIRRSVLLFRRVPCGSVGHGDHAMEQRAHQVE